jgi:hypothetical protein
VWAIARTFLFSLLTRVREGTEPSGAVERQKRIRLRWLEIEDCGGDGIDFKNKNDANEDIELSCITVRRHGLRTRTCPTKPESMSEARRGSAISKSCKSDMAPQRRPGFASAKVRRLHRNRRAQVSSVRVQNYKSTTGIYGLDIVARHVTATAGYVDGLLYG